MNSFRGMPINTSLLLTVPYEDWSAVRSPSRARRRLKQGHRQQIKYLQVPNPEVFVIAGTIHGHPETIKTMLKLANAQEVKHHGVR